MRFELHQLRYFVAVAHHRSFTKAALEHHIAQPSISQQIKYLEGEIGGRLFDRIGNRVFLTTLGEVLLVHAQNILAQLETAEVELREALGTSKGRVVAGSLQITGAHVLPSVLSEFRVKYPGIEVMLREETTAGLLSITKQGLTDISLMSLPIQDSELLVEPLLVEDLWIALPSDHPLAERTEPLALADLAGEPFILMKEGNGFRDVTLGACHRAGFVPHVVFESGNIETIQALVGVGLGISMVPQMARRKDSGTVFRELAAPTPTRTLVLVRRKDRYFSAAARAFRDCMVEVCERMNRQ